MSPLSTQPLSPLDGRYQHQVSALGEHLSEAGLNRARIQVEVEWLIHLTEAGLFDARRLAGPGNPGAVHRRVRRRGRHGRQNDARTVTHSSVEL